MNDDLNFSLPPADPPDAAVLSRIMAQMAKSGKPVRPLPPNAILWAVSFGVFALVSTATARATGFKATAVLSSGEMWLYYGALVLLAGLFGRSVIERMIPGEKRLLRGPTLWIGSLLLLGVLMAVLFADHNTQRFVASGVPCLRLGVISALLSGLLGWGLLRRGYLVSARETLVLYGFFAGLAGVATLALHCPIRNSLHCLVWHLGAMVIAGLAGLVIGRAMDAD